jgi:CheY-like chemotaxis protein
VSNSPENDSPAFAPLRVLYVEDNRLSALLFEETLRDFPQLLLDIAEDANDALQFACNTPPDVLVIDAHLPSMTGHDLLPLLRNLPSMSNVPAFMCSADASTEDREKALSAGFIGFWTKPIDILEVRSELCRLAQQKWAGNMAKSSHNVAHAIST